MAATTGIAWTNGTVNFWIGCTHCGPGCDGCYAEQFALHKFNVRFGPGERRMKTQAGFVNPVRWQKNHERAFREGGVAMMKENGQMVPVPVWVFANSLSDFFDNEIDPAWRAEAWAVIKACHHLRWQLVTKRVGNIVKMLPDDWNGGKGYEHVGIVATMVTQTEVERDLPKLVSAKIMGDVRWIGLSIEPQLGPISLIDLPGAKELDWIITGGESKQGSHAARPYDAIWAHDLIAEGAILGCPVFVKQMGDNPVLCGKPLRRLKQGGKDPSLWAPALRVQQMPRIYEPPLPPIGGLF